MKIISVNPPIYDALVIGAGFSGLYQAHRLRDTLQISCLVLEAGDGVGGTWYWNRYPGARCDTESNAYMYYFSQEIIDAWEWSERYPQQPEIQRYLNFVTDKLGLRPNIQCNTRVQSANYDESTQRWTVTTDTQQQFECTYLITAIGCLSSANEPDIPGRDDFSGACHHTGQWPHEGVDFAGKRVAVIGTGSTGIQVIPVIAQQAAEVTVFQRTANYSIPARNAPLTSAEKEYVKTHTDDLRHVMTHNTNGHAFWIDDVQAFDVTDAERQAKYQTAWDRGGLQFRATFKDLLTSQASNDTAASFIKTRILEVVKDPQKAADLTDFDHPFGAKRPPIDSHYFETFNLAHVNLVNLRKDPIQRITALGIQTDSALHLCDIIVFATGFDAMTGAFNKIAFTGRDGHNLKDVWRGGPKTYLGLQIPGFPNLFTITGPGSPSVLCNLPPQIEQHVDWITACIAYLRQHGIATIEATNEATERWGDEVNRAANATLLASVKHSWYLGANVPGKPRMFMPYAGGLKRYRDECDAVAADNYRGFALQ
jgi:cation diffusion facilitator CzcD-associated flavoprotein CzcO